MSQRSEGRKAKLLETRRAKKPTAGQQRRINREKTSRCWYELKNVHKRSAGHFQNVARLLAQYNNIPVIAKINTNGQSEEFDSTIAKIAELAPTFQVRLKELWAAHEHKAYLCRGYQDMMNAYELYEKYQKFDADIYLEISPLIETLNEIYNGALTQLREAAVAAGATFVEPASAEALDQPDVLAEPQAEAEEAEPVVALDPGTDPMGIAVMAATASEQPAASA